MNRQTIATIILVIILLALGALWYLYWTRLPSDESDETPGVSVDSYRQVKNLKLDTALFSDPVFRELKQEVISPPATEAVGRSNPFLPF